MIDSLVISLLKEQADESVYIMLFKVLISKSYLHHDMVLSKGLCFPVRVVSKGLYLGGNSLVQWVSEPCGQVVFFWYVQELLLCASARKVIAT